MVPFYSSDSPVLTTTTSCSIGMKGVAVVTSKTDELKPSLSSLRYGSNATTALHWALKTTSNVGSLFSVTLEPVDGTSYLCNCDTSSSDYSLFRFCLPPEQEVSMQRWSKSWALGCVNFPQRPEAARTRALILSRVTRLSHFSKFRFESGWPRVGLARPVPLCLHAT